MKVAASVGPPGAWTNPRSRSHVRQSRPPASVIYAHNLLYLPRIERQFLQEALCRTSEAAKALDHKLNWIDAEARRGTCPLAVCRMRWGLLAGSAHEKLLAIAKQLHHTSMSTRSDECGQRAKRVIEQAVHEGAEIVIVYEFFAPCIAEAFADIDRASILSPAPQLEYGLLTGEIDRPMVGDRPWDAMCDEK